MPLIRIGQDVSVAQAKLVAPSEVFKDELIQIISKLHQDFNSERLLLLKKRHERQKEYDSGKLPEFGNKNSEALKGQWSVAPIPADLQIRRVEITGPVNDPKMVINMLSRNSEGIKADTAMLDFEDSMMPSWDNVMMGYKNIRGVALGDLTYIKPSEKDSPEKVYQLNSEDMAHPMVRVRGLHLSESNFLVKGEMVSAGLLDLVTSAYLSSKEFIKRGKTPKFYVPKCEHHGEARWWHDLFSALEKELYLPFGTLKVTFLIETLPAAFLMEEILYEIKDRAVALNVGRWDKIFSDIKVLREHKERISPDRATIGMDRPWMENYAKRLVKVCHKRGAMAIGGMSAFTPGKDVATREAQTKKVLADKEREYRLGHDGCWVSHPYFIGVAMSAFKSHSQVNKPHDDIELYPNLLMEGVGPNTMAGLRTNLRVGVAYLEGWNQGIGCVSYDNLMEDLATLEISRAQTWQWLHHKVKLVEGMIVTKELINEILLEEMEIFALEQNKKDSLYDLKRAQEQVFKLFTKETLDNFLTEVSPKAY